MTFPELNEQSPGESARLAFTFLMGRTGFDLDRLQLNADLHREFGPNIRTLRTLHDVSTLTDEQARRAHAIMKRISAS
jgi:hypothetical protein